MSWTIIAPIITALASLLGVYWSNQKTTAVIELRIKNLEDTINKHNQVIDRMIKLEQKVEDMEKKGA